MAALVYAWDGPEPFFWSWGVSRFHQYNLIDMMRKRQDPNRVWLRWLWEIPGRRKTKELKRTEEPDRQIGHFGPDLKKLTGNDGT